MTRKKTLCVSLVLLLTVSIALVGIPCVHAHPLTLVSLNPTEITVSAPDQNFTIDVNVTDVTDLKGFAIMLTYNTTILDAKRVYETNISAGAAVHNPVDANGTFHWDGPPTINETIGRVWVAFFGFPTFTGNGTYLKINFTATAVGNTSLHFYLSQLLDPMAEYIGHTALDGSATVLPEFPTFTIIPLLLIATLAATLAKMFWSRKRKDAPMAK